MACLHPPLTQFNLDLAVSMLEEERWASVIERVGFSCSFVQLPCTNSQRTQRLSLHLARATSDVTLRCMLDSEPLRPHSQHICRAH